MKKLFNFLDRYQWAVYLVLFVGTPLVYWIYKYLEEWF